MKKPKTTSPLHPRNPHHGRYDFDALTRAMPKLAQHSISNPNGEPTIDFNDAQAVITLNQALLAHHYGIKFWDLPKGYLCPPIPSRADYIHHIADLLNTSNANNSNSDDEAMPSLATADKGVYALDIGTGASCIYPIIGVQAYGWRFTATDIDPISVNTAKLICQSNPPLKNKISIKQQSNPQHIFYGIIGKHDYFDISVCNPPFHASLDEATSANQRKRSNLKKHRQQHSESLSSINNQTNSTDLNFGGQQAELWCVGGELSFISQMITESVDFAHQVGWFTTLVSKSENLKPLQALLKTKGASKIEVINMQHGQKKTRILAWRFT